MVEISRIGEGGRIVIPAEIRDALNLHKGDYVSFSVEQGRVVMKKVVFQEVEA